jgi:hypothetical protein
MKMSIGLVDPGETVELSVACQFPFTCALVVVVLAPPPQLARKQASQSGTKSLFISRIPLMRHYTSKSARIQSDLTACQ